MQRMLKQQPNSETRRQAYRQIARVSHTAAKLQQQQRSPRAVNLLRSCIQLSFSDNHRSVYKVVKPTSLSPTTTALLSEAWSTLCNRQAITAFCESCSAV
jgi:hypothetical protein